MYGFWTGSNINSSICKTAISDRGHWSDAWYEQIGFIQPHMLHEGDPVRRRMAEERMKHPPVRFDDEMMSMIESVMRDLVSRADGGLLIQAMAIEPTHMHVLLPYARRDIRATAKWIADQTTKFVHALTDHAGPIWSKGKWCSFVFDRAHWDSAERYIDAHNMRAGRPVKPAGFPIHRAQKSRGLRRGSWGSAIGCQL